MIDYSYLSPPSKVTRIKLPRISSLTKHHTFTNASTVDTSVASSPVLFTNPSSVRPSTSSRNTSRKKHQIFTTPMNCYCGSITREIFTSLRWRNRSSSMTNGTRTNSSPPSTNSGGRYSNLDSSTPSAEITIIVQSSSSDPLAATPEGTKRAVTSTQWQIYLRLFRNTCWLGEWLRNGTFWWILKAGGASSTQRQWCAASVRSCTHTHSGSKDCFFSILQAHQMPLSSHNLQILSKSSTKMFRWKPSATAKISPEQSAPTKGRANTGALCQTCANIGQFTQQTNTRKLSQK